jgi:hypothetical protein
MKKRTNLFHHSLHLALGAAMLLLARVDAAAEPPESCTRFQLSPQPEWITAAAVLPDATSRVLVADASADSRRLIVYDATLRHFATLDQWSTVGYSPADADARFQPLSFEVADSGLVWLRLIDYYPLWLDPELHVLAEPRAVDHSRPSPLPPASVSFYSNTRLLGDDYLFGYGALIDNYTDAKPPFELGFVSARVSRADPEPTAPRLLLPHADNSYYLLGYSYAATNRTGAYAVAIGQGGVGLYQVFPGAESTPPLRLPEGLIPERFRTAPPLGNPERSRREAPTALSVFESSRVVAGLYGLEDRLYLLTRESTAGMTEWLLHELRPAGDPPVAASFRLPVSSPHLTIALGTEFSYFFERGHVEADGGQQIPNAVRIPTALLRDGADSPFLIDRPFVQCASAGGPTAL